MKKSLCNIAIISAVLALPFCNCQNKQKENHAENTSTNTSIKLVDSIDIQNNTKSIDSPSEAAMREMGLVDITEVDSTIQVRLMYATEDNFMHRILYPNIHKAFMLPELAEKLKKAQSQLRATHPGWSLIVYDAARPLSVQRVMWAEAQKSGFTHYVANPDNAQGMHNYAAAVDVSIENENGTAIDMGTPFDWFGEEAHITEEERLVSEGKITQAQMENRRLLRKIMTDNGMLTIRSEWWHFEMVRATRAQSTLEVIP